MDEQFLTIFQDLFKTTPEYLSLQDERGPKIACPECDKSDIKMLAGNYVCLDCSCIVSRNIDSQAEWRNFADAPDVSRCSSSVVNEFFPSSTIGTVMGYSKNRGSLKGNARREEAMARLTNQWNNSSYEERNMQSMFNMLITHNNEIPKSIIKDAEYICKSFIDQNIIRGDSKENMVATCVYLAYKKNQVPRHKKEIAKMFKISEHTFCKSSKKFEEHYSQTFRSSKASDFIMRMASNVGMDEDDASECVEYCKTIQGKIGSSKPTTLAAACIFRMYPAVDQAELEKHAFVSKNRFRALERTLPEHVQAQV